MLARLKDVIKQLAVMRSDVLHIGHVFVAALNLEAAHPGVHQVGDVVALVVVFHAQHMFVVRDKAALVVDHLVGQAASLAAFATVGAAPGVRGGNKTLAAVGHTQGTVHKKLDGTTAGVGGGANSGYLPQGEFACQHQLRQAGVL